MQVEVHLLGPVELCVDGRPVALPAVTQRVLLARLALAAGRVVPVADLVDALWGDETPENAVGNLHSYVSRLRGRTGVSVVVREPAGYRLGLPAEAVDVAQVERLVSAARGRAPREAAELLATALGTWRGDALSDVADRLAFVPDAARLTSWRAQLQQEWLTRRLEAGDAVAALPDVEALAHAEPLREGPQLLLMRALHQTGRTADALAVGRAFRERVADEHGIDPGPAIDELQQQILTGEAVAPRQPQPQLRPEPRVPVAVDRFVGRATELAALRSALATDRVTTVVGPGGAGKTRLVREALTADALVVELAAVSAPADVASAVAGALGVRVAPRGGTAAVVERLGSSPVVLVLDNCEHLLDAVRDLVVAVTAACPQVRVLATSRQRLDVGGERVLRLGPLPEQDQVELFVDRASRLRTDFSDDARTRALAGEVCRLVDGLPLGVELAARREAVFGLVQLRDRLGAGLQVLDPVRGGDRSSAVSATVEWSYRLLDPAAQRLLDRLSVCRGGFSLDAVSYFSPDGERLLADLVDASLVSTDLSSDPPRYRLLETVRHVGLQHLDGEAARDARAAHARWMVDHVAELYRLQTVRDPSSVLALRRELVNAQEALTWLEESGQRDDLASLAASLATVSSDDPAPALSEQLTRLAPTEVVTIPDALLATAAGNGMWLGSSYAEADRLFTGAIEVLPEGHQFRWSPRLFRLANAMFAGRVEAVHRDARALAADPSAPDWARAQGACCAALIDHYAGDPGAWHWIDDYADVLGHDDQIGFVAFTRGELLTVADPEAALSWFDRSLAQSALHSHTYIQVIAGIGRASVLIRMGRTPEAVAASRALAVAATEAGMTAQAWTMLRLTAELLASLGDPATAVAVLDAADRHPLAPVVLGPDVRRHEAIRAQAAGARHAGVAGTAATATGATGATGATAATGDTAAVVATVLAALDRVAGG